MSDHFDLVIVGNSAAGLQAVRTVRKHNDKLSVAIIDREDCPAYSRVMTPYFIGDKIPREDLFIVDKSFYRQMSVTPLFGQSVEQINTGQQKLTLTDGRQIDYGKLLLATGAEARSLTLSSERAQTLRHMADAEKLARMIGSAHSITAIGAGLVSLPLLSHAASGIEKHLVVGSGRVFSRVVDAEASAVLEEHFRQAGLQMHLQDDVETITEKEQLHLTLTSGRQLVTDLLIVGKGVTPNLDLAREAGLQVNDGVLIDAHCRTGNPCIYAAGDVAEGKDFITGKPTIQGNWVTAVEQAEIAALNMLGRVCTYEGSLKNNITEVFGIDVAAVGYCQDDAARTVTCHNRATGRFRKVFLNDKDRVIGATMIGETNDAGCYYQMVRTRSEFPGEAMLSGSYRYTDILQRLE